MIANNAPIPNTFGLKVKAKYLAEYNDEDELLAVLSFHAAECPDMPMFHMGDGSNLLFLGDYEGLVLRSRIRGIELLREDDEDVYVRIGAGETCDDIIAYCISKGWYGLENLSLIPSQIGAAAVQNIGAYGVEFGELVDCVYAVDLQTGKHRQWQQEECLFGYRSSVFKSLKEQVAITHVDLRLHRHFKPCLSYGGLRDAVAAEHCLTANRMREIIIAIRQAKLPDPAETGSAGSFFKNPVVDREVYEALAQRYPTMPHYPAADGMTKLSAGWLIEQTGWKGRDLGRAGVYEKQALILVNRGGAEYGEIVALYTRIIADVEERFGIRLHPEVITVKA